MTHTLISHIETPAHAHISHAGAPHSFTVRCASQNSTVFAAQALQQQTPLHKQPTNDVNMQIDSDTLDALCEHLLMIDDASQKVVGTCTLLRPYRAQRCGQYYGERHFSGLLWQHVQNHAIELGPAQALQAIDRVSFPRHTALKKLFNLCVWNPGTKRGSTWTTD